MKKVFIFFFVFILASVLASPSHSEITPINYTEYAVTYNNDIMLTSDEQDDETQTQPPTPEDNTDSDQTCDTIPVCKYGLICINGTDCFNNNKTTCCNPDGTKNTINDCKYNIALSQQTLDTYNIIIDKYDIECCYSQNDKTYYCQDDPTSCSFKGVNADYISKLESYLPSEGEDESPIPTSCYPTDIINTSSINCSSKKADEQTGTKFVICAGDFSNRPNCKSTDFDPYPTRELGFLSQDEDGYFACNTNQAFDGKTLFGFSTFPYTDTCQYEISKRASDNNEKWIIPQNTTPTEYADSKDCLDAISGKIIQIFKINETGCHTKKHCEETLNGKTGAGCSYKNNDSDDPTNFYKCSCPDGYYTLQEYKDGCGMSFEIIGTGKVCTADGGSEKFKDYNISLKYPLCEVIISTGNSKGEEGKRDGWYTYNKSNASPQKIDCLTNDYIISDNPVYQFCPESSLPNVANSFKASTCKNNKCADGFSCKYPDNNGNETTVCTKCYCDAIYKTKEDICKADIEGEYTATPSYNTCMTEGIVENSCQLDITKTLYNAVSCPNKFKTKEEWWEVNKNNDKNTEEMKFLATQLGIANIEQWKDYYIPEDVDANTCTYEATVSEVRDDNGKLVTDEDTGETLTEVKRTGVKYTSFHLSCKKIQDSIQRQLEYTFENDEQNRKVPCWDEDNKELKYLISCSTDYILPAENYIPNRTEEFCAFGKIKYYKHGGDCPTIYSGNDAIVDSNISDKDLKETYGNVVITYCNNNGVKKKLLHCDPDKYNLACTYPYELENTDSTPQFCRRETNGKLVTENSEKHYINDDQTRCIYNPTGCDREINELSQSGNKTELVNNPQYCSKYGTAIQTKACKEERNNIELTKYICYYKPDDYKYNTQNCGLGKDLSGPYILKNGAKHWSSCDCASFYKYHNNNCRGGLTGKKCIQETVSQQFLDNRPTDTTLVLNSKNLELYTGCTETKSEVDSGCKVPTGIWARCYYCCPAGTKPTGVLSKNSCGQKIYECK